jgi:hypothetical protein
MSGFIVSSDQSATSLPNLEVCIKTEHTPRDIFLLVNIFNYLAYDWTRFGRLVADWSDETMNPDMIPYGMLLDLSNV